MKNLIYFILSVLLILGSIYVLKPVFFKNRLPSVYYYNLENVKVKLNEIELKEKVTYVFYVSPNCEYCKDIKKILDTISIKKHNRIIITSYEKNINYKIYKENFNLKKNDFFLIDKNNNFVHDFNVNYSYSIPLILKFDKY